MVTFVGSQNSFEDALKELVELEYGAIDAYETATEQLDNPRFKAKLNEFKSDHERHLQELTTLFKNNNVEVPQKGVLGKQLLTTGKVLMATIVGDNAILRAMLSNEKDTNTAYERMNDHDEQWPDAVAIIKKGLADERKHKAWIEEVLS